MTNTSNVLRRANSGHTVSGASGTELLREWSERLAESRRGGNGGSDTPPSPAAAATPRSHSAALDDLGQPISR